jgi:hypothetical protein
MTAISSSEAETCRGLISRQDGVQYTGFKFITLSGRVTLLFISPKGQRVLTAEHVKQIIREG